MEKNKQLDDNKNITFNTSNSVSSNKVCQRNTGACRQRKRGGKVVARRKINFKLANGCVCHTRPNHVDNLFVQSVDQWRKITTGTGHSLEEKMKNEKNQHFKKKIKKIKKPYNKLGIQSSLIFSFENFHSTFSFFKFNSSKFTIINKHDGVLSWEKKI